MQILPCRFDRKFNLGLIVLPEGLSFRYYKILTEKKIQCLLLELLRTALSNKQITKGKYKVSSKYKDKDLLVALLFLIYDREVSM